LTRGASTGPASSITERVAARKLFTSVVANESDVRAGNAHIYQSFSDSIVISSNASNSGLIYLLASINELALTLLSNGLLTRGGIAKGKLHHDGPVMFGPAFLETYRLETTIAVYPRIVLSRSAYEHFRAMLPGLQYPQVLLADDGPPYLHIFAHLSRLISAADAKTGQFTVADKCRMALQNLLNNSIYEPNHHAKLRWLTIYWNSTFALAQGPQSRVKFPQEPHAAVAPSVGT
jgi:hypothetical protein